MRIVLYHAHCTDGFTAAWAAHRALGDQDVEYRAVSYGDPIPQDLKSWDHVYLLDFSYKAAEMARILDDAGRVIVLDHHETAIKEIGKLEVSTKLEVTLDQERSGAGITWDVLFPHNPRPALVNYVEDRDLWRFRLPFSRAISQYLNSYPQTFEIWDLLAHVLDEPTLGFQGAVSEGQALTRAMDQVVTQMAARAVFRYIDGIPVPVVNATAYFSEVGDVLCRRYPSAPFAAYYFDRVDGMRQWGLRSGPDGANVADIASRRGGGGHPHAAGFQEPLGRALPPVAVIEHLEWVARNG